MKNKFFTNLLALSFLLLHHQIVKAYSDLDSGLRVSTFDFLNPKDLANLAQCSQGFHKDVKLHKTLRKDYTSISEELIPLQYLYSGKEVLEQLSLEQKIEVLKEVHEFFIRKNPSYCEEDSLNRLLAEVYHAVKVTTDKVFNRVLQERGILYGGDACDPGFIMMQNTLHTSLRRDQRVLTNKLHTIEENSALLKIIEQDGYTFSQNLRYKFLHKKSVERLENKINKLLSGKSPVLDHVEEVFEELQTLLLDEVLSYAYQHLAKEYQGPSKASKKAMFGCILNVFAKPWL